jgi:hypothetical protein
MRERRRRGIVAVVMIEVTDAMAFELVERGHLGEWDDQDGAAIGAAIRALLRVTLGESST